MYILPHPALKRLPQIPPSRRLRIELLAFLLCLGLFVYGAVTQGNAQNTEMHTDQDAYIAYAQNMHNSDFNYVGGRNRMPVYVSLQALFYDPATMDDDAFFTVGKRVNIGLAILGITLIYLLLRKRVEPLPAVNITLLSGFSVFMMKAPYFQAEILYYILIFLVFIGMLAMLNKPRLWHASGLGLLCGLTYLTKASALPAAGLFVGIMLVQSLVQRSFRPALCAMLFAVTFTAILWPYISTSKERFGQYFYNVNSTFYMWYDSWDEAKAGTRAFGDRNGWPDMPEEQIPNLSRYIGTHSISDIWERFRHGVRITWGYMATQYDLELYFFLYAFAIVFLMKQAGSRHVQTLLRQHWPVIVFSLCFFGGYLCSYIWWVSGAGAGPRHVMALVLPALFALQLAVQALTRLHRPEWVRWFYYAIFTLVLLDMHTILNYRIHVLYGGA